MNDSLSIQGAPLRGGFFGAAMQKRCVGVGSSPCVMEEGKLTNPNIHEGKKGCQLLLATEKSDSVGKTPKHLRRPSFTVSRWVLSQRRHCVWGGMCTVGVPVGFVWGGSRRVVIRHGQFVCIGTRRWCACRGSRPWQLQGILSRVWFKVEQATVPSVRVEMGTLWKSGMETEH